MAILTSALVATSQFEAAEKILAKALIRLERRRESAAENAIFARANNFTSRAR